MAIFLEGKTESGLDLLCTISAAHVAKSRACGFAVLCDAQVKELVGVAQRAPQLENGRVGGDGDSVRDDTRLRGCLAAHRDTKLGEHLRAPRRLVNRRAREGGAGRRAGKDDDDNKARVARTSRSVRTRPSAVDGVTSCCSVGVPNCRTTRTGMCSGGGGGAAAAAAPASGSPPRSAALACA